MKIPHEWVSEICNNINRNFPGPTMEPEKTFAKYWYTKFNDAWDLRPDFYEDFKPFFIKIVSWQCNFSVHPLTCNVDSRHDLLVPRFGSNNSLTPCLVCPTCGSIQFYIPI